MRSPISRGASSAPQTTASLLAGAFLVCREKKAKTSGPARALANNANAEMAKDVFIGGLIAPARPVAVKPHPFRENDLARSARRKRKILLNMSIHEQGKAGAKQGLASRFRPIRPASADYRQAHTSGNTMQQIKKQADRERAQYVQLVDQYRAIGPAALVAALLHTSKKRKTSIASKAA